MMTASELKEFAQLSQATYAHFETSDFAYNGGVADDAWNNLKEPPNTASAFCDKEAKDFTARYEILHQCSDDPAVNFDSNGFSATLFRDKNNGHLVLGFRGTEFDNDKTRDLFSTDLRIGIDGYASPQAIAEYRYIKQLMTPAGQAVQYTEQELTNLSAIYWDFHPVSPDPQIALVQQADWNALQARILADKGVDAGQGSVPLIASTEDLSLTGHSLGGHLAMLATRLFPQLSGVEVVTVNAPGFFPSVDTILSSFSSRFSDKITRMESVGDGVSEIGAMRDNPLAFPGQTITVGMETRPGLLDPFGANHSCANIADGLKLIELFGKLDSRYAENVRLMIPLFNVSSQEPISSYEYLLDKLRNAILGADISVTVVETDNQPQTRDDFYQKANALADNEQFVSLVGKLKIDVSPANLIDRARTDFSAFLSLFTLSPIILSGTNATNQACLDDLLKTAWEPEYQQWHDDITSSDSERTFTDTYLQDRTKMLSYIIQANLRDISPDNSTGLIQWVDATDQSNHFFSDKQNNTTISVTGSAYPSIPGINPAITFGSQSDDSIHGTTGVDHIYGDAGNDVIYGNAGNDYLEGNAGIDFLNGGENDDILIGGAGDDTLNGDAGNDYLEGGLGIDTYRIVSGEGTDTILDADGFGYIQWDGLVLSGSSGLAADKWKHPGDQGEIVNVL